MARQATDHQVATVVSEDVYVQIRVAAALEQKSVSEWFREIITPLAAASAREYAANGLRNRKGRPHGRG